VPSYLPEITFPLLSFESPCSSLCPPGATFFPLGNKTPLSPFVSDSPFFPKIFPFRRGYRSQRRPRLGTFLLVAPSAFSEVGPSAKPLSLFFFPHLNLRPSCARIARFFLMRLVIWDAIFFFCIPLYFFSVGAKGSRGQPW